MNISGASFCSACIAGYFASEDMTLRTTCRACLAGYYASTNGSALCFPCAPVSPSTRTYTYIHANGMRF
jgi:hypothetical protein